MIAVVAGCSAALLGTSDDSPSATTPAATTQITHLFARDGIEGGTIGLSADQPRATFFVTIVADDLGPKNVTTTNMAVAHLHGSVVTTDLAAGTVAPSVLIDSSSPDTTAGATEQVTDQIAVNQPLVFTGDCTNPTTGTCRARFQVALSRDDDGAAGGTVNVDWTFDVESAGFEPSTTSSEVPAVDPPWTISVTAE